MKITTSTLINYLNGHCTPDAKEAVDQWLEEHDKNARKLEAVQRLYEAGKVRPSLTINADQAWQNIEARLNNSSQSKKEQRVIPIYQKYWRGIAAAIALLLVAAAVFFSDSFNPSNQPVAYEEIVGQKGQVRLFTLPDASQVWLAEGAILRYSMSFEPRSVELSGKAFFEVVPDDSRFTIHTGQSKIEVLGTSFSVESDIQKTRIAVHEGKVRVSKNNSNADVILEKNQVAVVSEKAKDIISRTANLENDLSWKTGILTFQNTPLADVVAKLQSHYGVSVVIGSSNQGSCRLTARFDNEPVDAVMKSIAKIMGLTLEKPTGKSYKISGKSC